MSQKKHVRLQRSKDPIFEGLKRLFDDVIQEPVPAEFLDLLAKIDAKAEEEDLARKERA